MRNGRVGYEDRRSDPYNKVSVTAIEAPALLLLLRDLSKFRESNSGIGTATSSAYVIETQETVSPGNRTLGFPRPLPVGWSSQRLSR